MIVQTDTQRGHPLAAVMLTCAAVAWLIGTPVLAYGAFIMSASFFGEPPSPQDMTAARWALAGAVACGAITPAGAAVVAARLRWRRTAWLFCALLAITAGAVLVLVAGVL